MTQMDRRNRRHGEAPASYVRAARAFQMNDQWFFGTREGIDVGPYTTRDEAESAAADFATMLESITDPESARQFVIREFMLLRWRRTARSAHQ